MYVTLPGITNGQSTELLHTIDNSDGQLEVTLCNVTYYPWWTNINAAKRSNEMFILGENDVIDKNIIIPDGYYSVCSLNDEIFKSNAISLTQNKSNGMLIFNAGEEGVFNFKFNSTQIYSSQR